VYINSDGNGRGYAGRGRLALAREIHQRRGARYRRSGKEDHGVEARSAARIRARRPPERDEVRKRSDLRIGALGSGSDYTAFLDHWASLR
jgi:N-acetylated-alpha-linked acidic dipeptidase